MGNLNSYKSGIWAEYLTAAWLTLKGYRILKNRFKTPVGEVDIIAKRGKLIVFVEVKYRSQMDDARAAVQPGAMTRIRRASEWWLKNNAALADKCDIRFDVVAVAPYLCVKHIQNAF